MARALTRAVLAAVLCAAAGTAGASGPAREASLSGTLRLPAGAAPGPGRLRVVLSGIDGGPVEEAVVDARGRYRFARAAAGWHRLNYAGLEGASGLAQGAYAVVWLEPGKDTVFDLAAAAPAGVAVEGATAAPPASPHHSLLYVMGLPPGQAPPVAAAALLSEEEGAPVALRQGPGGRWASAYSFERGAAAPAAYSAGIYDFYLVQRQDPKDAIAVRPLAALPGVRLSAGETTPLRFPASAPSGPCVLEGRLKLSKFRASEGFSARRTLAPLLQEVVPHVHLFDASGAYAGTAFAVLGDDDLLSLMDAAAGGRPERAAARLAAKAWEYRIRDLPPGSYRLRFEAAGYAPVERTATLRPGKAAALDLDFDAAAGGPAASGAPPLAAELRGHRTEVLAALFAPDGKTVVSAADDGAVRLWGLDGAPLAELRVPGGSFNGLDLSADGALIAAGADDGSVFLWRAADRKELWRVRPSTEAVNAVLFLPGSGRVLAAGDDASIRVLDARDGKVLGRWLGHAGAVRALAASRDGRLVYSGGADGAIRLWTADGRVSGGWRAQDGTVFSLALSPRGDRLASGGDDKLVSVWRLPDGAREAAWTGHGSRVLSVAYSADGTRLVSSDDEGFVKVWNAAAGKVVRAWRAHQTSVFCARFSPDGRRLLTAGWEGLLKLWTLDEAKAPAAAAAPAGVDADAEQLQAVLGRLDSHLAWTEKPRFDPRKTALGRALFFDGHLSRNGLVSCGTCHQPAKAFSDGVPRAVGILGRVGPRRTPSLLDVGYHAGNLFWDGRASTVQQAALAAIANPLEMDLDPKLIPDVLKAEPAVVKRMKELYGEAPAPADVADALAAYVSTLGLPEMSAFDRFRAKGEPLPPEARRGFLLFAGKARCIRCHNGANFTDNRFHNIGLKPLSPPDLGRGALVRTADSRRSFRTPSLRNVEARPPYMHDGRFATLSEVVDFYDRGGDTEDTDQSIAHLGLSKPEKEELVAFLKTLTSPGALPAPPLAGAPGALGSLRGTVRRADGRPVAAGKPLDLRLRSVITEKARTIRVGEDGAFDSGPLEPGWYVLQLGPLPPEDAQPAPRTVKIAAGATRSLDLEIEPSAALEARQERDFKGALRAQMSARGLQYFLVGLTPRQTLPEASFYFLSEEEGAPFALRAGADGEWRAPLTKAPAARFAPGTYAVYLTELEDFPGKTLATRLLDSRPAAALAAGSTTEYPLPRTFSAPSATAVDGTIRAEDPPAAASSDGFASAAQIFAQYIPRVDFYQGDAYRGSAYAALTDEELAVMFDALSSADDARLRALYRGKTWPLRIHGLAPGRYTARGVFPGRPVVEKALVLEDGKTAAPAFDLRP